MRQTNDTPDHTPDDTSRYFIGAGIVTDETDIINCHSCGFTVMPWMMFCEACGKNPHERPESERSYGCLFCGDSHEYIEDAENCCLEPPERERAECEQLDADANPGECRIAS